MKTELHTLSAAEIGSLVNDGKITPTEVVQYFLERIYKLNPELNAFVYVREKEALDKARELENKLKSGVKLGPFAGVPFALKDFLPSKKGWTNTHGGVISLQAVDHVTANFCRSMERAGGIALGKTNAPAFGFRGTTDNKLYGPTHNPYNYFRNSGGSSGGSAAAVAAGLVPIAEGGDAGGSIRIPAAWCGCYGFKATAGLIPNVCRPDAWTATHVYCTPGGLTKTVEDAAILLSYMSGYSPRDPLSQWGGRHDFQRSLNDTEYDIEDFKIAYTLDFGIFNDLDEEVCNAVVKTARELELMGASVDFLPNVITRKYTSDELAQIWCKIISIDSALELVTGKLKPVKEDLPEEFLYWQDQVLKSNILDFSEYNKVKTMLIDDFCNVFEEYDILLSPVTTCLPVENAEVRGETKGPEGHEQLIGFCETFMYNMTGNPAASVPVGFSKDGLPLGVQVAGPKFGDEEVLQISHEIEQLNK